MINLTTAIMELNERQLNAVPDTNSDSNDLFLITEDHCYSDDDFEVDETDFDFLPEYDIPKHIHQLVANEYVLVLYRD